ncbi:MAG: hypothetical protein AAGJ80_17595, partial [Cyanobacteria bacterium J06553_1]
TWASALGATNPASSSAETLPNTKDFMTTFLGKSLYQTGLAQRILDGAFWADIDSDSMQRATWIYQPYSIYPINLPTLTAANRLL